MTGHDIPEAVLMGAEMREESSQADMDFSPEKAIRMAHRLLLDENCLCLIADIEGPDGTDTAGMLAARISQDSYGSDFVTDDYFLYVKPEYRGSSAAPRLLNAYEQWARDKGGKYAYLRQATGIKVEGVKALCEHAGYDLVGYVFRKRL